MSTRRGVPQAASLYNIIHGLFQNEKYRYNNLKYVVTFSRVSLTDNQKSQLIYPSEFTPLNLFILYQTDSYNEIDHTTTKLELISFLSKQNYIYGAYFNIFGQSRFDLYKLKDSVKPVELLSTVRLVNNQYIEVYNDILGTTVILGLNTGDSSGVNASLQYSHKCRYFFEDMSVDGIITPDLGETFLTGLSRNLDQNCHCGFSK